VCLDALVVGSDEEIMRAAVGSEEGLVSVDTRVGNTLSSTVVGCIVGGRVRFIAVGFALISATRKVGPEAGCVVWFLVGVPFSVWEVGPLTPLDSLPNS
jgi:hypothetical protein